MKTSQFLPISIVLAVLGPAAANAQYVTAGTLYVDLRATNSSAGGAVWLNEAGGFGAGASPRCDGAGGGASGAVTATGPALAVARASAVRAKPS